MSNLLSAPSLLCSLGAALTKTLFYAGKTDATVLLAKATYTAHPQTHGMVKRFNGCISEIVNQTRFASAAEVESTPRNYLEIYNHNISPTRVKALNADSGIQEL